MESSNSGGGSHLVRKGRVEIFPEPSESQRRAFSAPLAGNVNGRQNKVYLPYHKGTRSKKGMIKIQNDVGRVLEWEAAEGEERHHDLIIGKYQYSARLKQAGLDGRSEYRKTGAQGEAQLRSTIP